jgi:hypothetical protein
MARLPLQEAAQNFSQRQTNSISMVAIVDAFLAALSSPRYPTKTSMRPGTYRRHAVLHHQRLAGLLGTRKATN